MEGYRKSLLSLVCSTFVSTVGYADMPVDFLTVDKTGGAVEYGTGYKIKSEQFAGQCVQFTSNDTYDGGSSAHESTFELAESTSDIVKKSNLSASASLKAVAGGATISASNKTSVVANSEASMYNLTLFASSYQYDQPKFRYFENAKLSDMAQALLADPLKKGEFKERCGDGFVIAIQEGRDFLGTATVKKQSLKQSAEFTSKTGLGVKSVGYEANADLDIAKTLTSTFGSNNFKIYTYNTGSDDADPSSVDELKAYFKNFFKNSKDYKRRVNFIIVPYTVLENYPYPDILQGDTKEDYIGYMADALWDLKAAIKDADFVLDSEMQKFFALGINQPTINNRTQSIGKYKNAWRKEFNDLLKAANQCNDNFTPQCQQLASYYRDDRKLSNQTAMIMPERYVNDCYTPIVLNPTENSQELNAQLLSGFDTVAGDNETGGNHMRVTSALNYFTDKRVMKADINIAKIEWKRDDWKGQPLEVRTNKGESGFGKKITMKTFDLDNPKNYGLPFDRKLDTCTWRDPNNPVKSAKIYRAPIGKNGFERYGFNGAPVHGVIDSISKKDSRGQAEYGPGVGDYNSIRCAVDAKGRSDNTLTCESVNLKSFELNLVSQQDLEANKWRDPNLYNEPDLLLSFLSGKTLNYKAKLIPIKSKYTIPASQLKILNKVNLKPMKMMVPSMGH